MDKKTLYAKAEKALNQAFEVAKKSVKAVSEKAGEEAHIIKLRIEKATLEHYVNRRFAELGNRVYEKSIKKGEENISLNDKDIQTIIEETKKLDSKLTAIEADIERERKTKAGKKTKSL